MLLFLAIGGLENKPAARAQKLNFAANCTSRDAAALVIRPKFELSDTNLQNVNFRPVCTSRGAAALTTWPNVALLILPSTDCGPKN